MSRHALSLKITSSHKDLQGLCTIIQPHFLFIERLQTKISHHCSISVIVNVAKLLSHVLLVNINHYYRIATIIGNIIHRFQVYDFAVNFNVTVARIVRLSWKKSKWHRTPWNNTIRAKNQLSTGWHVLIYICNADLYRFFGAENSQTYWGRFKRKYCTYDQLLTCFCCSRRQTRLASREFCCYAEKVMRCSRHAHYSLIYGLYFYGSSTSTSTATASNPSNRNMKKSISLHARNED